MKSGDLFEFLNLKNEPCEQDDFYDETLKRFFQAKSNIFMCITCVKNPDWCDTNWNYSLYFIDGQHFFHIRVNEYFHLWVNNPSAYAPRVIE